MKWVTPYSQSFFCFRASKIEYENRHFMTEWYNKFEENVFQIMRSNLSDLAGTRIRATSTSLFWIKQQGPSSISSE